MRWCTYKKEILQLGPNWETKLNSEFIFDRIIINEQFYRLNMDEIELLDEVLWKLYNASSSLDIIDILAGIQYPATSDFSNQPHDQELDNEAQSIIKKLKEDLNATVPNKPETSFELIITSIGKIFWENGGYKRQYENKQHEGKMNQTIQLLTEKNLKLRKNVVKIKLLWLILGMLMGLILQSLVNRYLFN
ncbi:MAG: hypothetical protein IH946_06715 [Bacteroidetes bacterium]|nr:hypothetical protein [Bacteroidota bacterium]